MSRSFLSRIAPAALTATGLTLGFGVAAGPALAADRAIIVLDASGSMWGQIDGKAKIEIARKTLGQVLVDLPKDLELGLIAYGHRQKGQCSDIELMVPAGAGTAGAISKAVNGLKPKGKTPLSSSVKMAAEALRYTEEKATVILITDGLETCDADPCALGRSLEELGVDFTAHVVGFGLSDKDGKEVACLAEETGGVYIPAGDEEELVNALDRAVIEEPKKAEVKEPEPEPEPEARLTALPEAEMLSAVTVRWDGPGEPRDRIELWDPNALAGEGKRARRIELRNGDIDKRTVSLVMPSRTGDYELRYVHKRKVLATRPISVTEIPVSLAVDGPATAATQFKVTWEGPGLKHDEVRLFDPNALGGEGKLLKKARVRNGDFEGRTVTMAAPAKAGTFQLQYYEATDRRILATLPLEVQDIAVSLDAPEAIEAGMRLKVGWEGPGAKYDEVQLWDPSAKGGEGKKVRGARIRNGDFEGRTVTMPAPAKPGSYELRYWNGDNRKVMASLGIEVIEIAVSLDAPEAIEAGMRLKVGWEGPGAKYDEVQLWDPSAKGGEGKKVRGARIRNGDFEGRTVTMPAPAKPGSYELRYWNGDNRKVMASLGIEVIEIAVSLTAPDTLPAGSVIKLQWEGPGARYDDVQLFDPSAKGGDGKVLRSKRLRNDDYDNKTARLPGPSKPGTYELRYWNGDSRTVMATRQIEITEIKVSLTAPDQIEAGRPIKVKWEGPGARYDDVQLFDPRAKGGEGKVLWSKRLNHADYDNRIATLAGPGKPGTYELRYWFANDGTVMATRTIEVTPIEMALVGPEAVEPETKFGLEWKGPGAVYDDVQIFDPKARGGKGKVVWSKRLRHADFENQKVTVVAPKTPGEYVIRYWHGESRTVMLEVPLSVN